MNLLTNKPKAHSELFLDDGNPKSEYTLEDFLGYVYLSMRFSGSSIVPPKEFIDSLLQEAKEDNFGFLDSQIDSLRTLTQEHTIELILIATDMVEWENIGPEEDVSKYISSFIKEADIELSLLVARNQPNDMERK